jgi:MOSC domain-containing protein YiiM
MPAEVVAVSLSPTHSFSKALAREITLLAGLGVAGDAHAGATVRHRYRVRKDPTAANLCQVHLIHQELFAELAGKGIAVAPGEMGENVTTRGIDLLGLPRGTRLHLGGEAIVEVTGLREPCDQMNQLRPGLMKACLTWTADGALDRKAGIMGIVIAGGVVRAGDAIDTRLPAGEPLPLYPV